LKIITKFYDQSSDIGGYELSKYQTSKLDKVEQTYIGIHTYTSLIADSHEKSRIRKKQSRRHLRTHNKIHTVLSFSTTPKPGTVQYTTFNPIDLLDICKMNEISSSQ
jgi:hypothetical protein